MMRIDIIQDNLVLKTSDIVKYSMLTSVHQLLHLTHFPNIKESIRSRMVQFYRVSTTTLPIS